ncbi:hypothetical protein BKA62DRAFT_713037 [Auriculariales sp. MPI-PUGE-AT-0066]|nr:hypothetical protein BKA62DRAFT_713037 [Auriculariales sp. MPI-PUGE-AT-0066]
MPPLGFSSIFDPASSEELLETLLVVPSVAAEMGKLFCCHNGPNEIEVLARIMSLCPNLNWLRIQTPSTMQIQQLCDTLSDSSVLWQRLRSLQWVISNPDRSNDPMAGENLSRLLPRVPNLEGLLVYHVALASSPETPSTLRLLECYQSGITMLTQLLLSEDMTQIHSVALYGRGIPKAIMDELHSTLENIFAAGRHFLLYRVRTLSLGKYGTSFPLGSPCARALVTHCINLRDLVLYIERRENVSAFPDIEILLAATGPRLQTLVINAIRWLPISFQSGSHFLLALLERRMQSGNLSRLRELMIFGIQISENDDGDAITAAFRQLGNAHRIAVRLVYADLWSRSSTCSHRI